jgi:hypothetical protein
LINFFAIQTISEDKRVDPETTIKASHSFLDLNNNFAFSHRMDAPASLLTPFDTSSSMHFSFDNYHKHKL